MASGDRYNQRLQELKDQQSRWMRERQAEIDRQRVTAEMQQEAAGGVAAVATGLSAASSGSGSVGTSFSTQQQQQQFQGSPYRQPGAGAAGRRTGLMDEAEQHASTSSPARLLQPQGAGALVANMRPEQVIDKLTERITDRLRSELKSELQRETQDLAAQAAAEAAKHDHFLAKELETQNTCPICYELMVPPERAPQLLFPCGHTFCASCARMHIEQHRRNHCPVCRKKIESRALNYPLQQLILNWVARRDAGRAPGGGPGGTFGAPAGTLAGESNGAPGGGSEESADDIRRRWEHVALRLRVLKNELLDVMAEEEAVERRRAAAATVVAHLADEERDALAQLAAAQAHLDLVRQQQAAQEAKSADIAEQASRLSASRAMLVATITPLEEEESKLQLLAAGLRESLQLR